MIAADTLAGNLVALLQSRDYGGVLRHWQVAPLEAREDETNKRLAAAALAQSGNLVGAYSLLEELAARASPAVQTLMLAGRVAFDLEHFPKSVTHFEHAVATDRANIDAWRWLADAALRARLPERALRGAEVHTLRFRHDVDLAIRAASLLALAGRCDEALVSFERILARWPHHVVAGPGFAEFVMREFPLEAAEILDRVHWQPQGDVLSAAYVRAALWLPAFYASEASAAEWIDRLHGNLQQLTAAAVSSELQGDARAHCLSTTPFFAAYHDADITHIQFAWGDFVEALVAPLRLEYPRPALARGPVRTIGIVSNRLTDSSAGRFFNPWLALLREAGFELRLYAIGSGDHVTDDLAENFSLKRFPLDDVTGWRPLAASLHEDNNDALLYPEPQGSQLIQLIAAIRFAPIQCAAFGNPLTTGLRTMDYFFVPDAAEVRDAAPFYRERVVRLAGLGIARPAAPFPATFDRAAFGLDARDHVILVSQQAQKWTPRFVSSILAIMARDPAAVLVYFSVASGVSVRAFDLYLRSRFREAGIDFAARTLAVSMLPRESYLALHRCADIALDSFGFSGGSSTLDAVATGLPVITLEGRHLRGRQSAAMLRAAGLGENVVSSAGEYIERALSLLGRSGPLESAHPLAPEGEAVPPAGVFRDVAAFMCSLGAEVG